MKLLHGHNKDLRPDCKQIVFGLNVTSDSHMPLSYQLYDGNQAEARQAQLTQQSHERSDYESPIYPSCDQPL